MTQAAESRVSGDRREREEREGKSAIAADRVAPQKSSDTEDEDAAANDGAETFASQSRRLRNSIVSLAIFFAIVVGLLLGVPSLDSATDRIERASAGWVAAALGLELLSCLGYVVLFELVFGRLGR
ncbi:MAG TPA: hypothetical protein VKV16_05380, partial [Solirubrobacteraceae bacterium]|nr:hypothetical protein [Solirubrobacteraceae bacterium]